MVKWPLFQHQITTPPLSLALSPLDLKLIGGTIHEFLAGVHLDSPDGGTIVTGAPAGYQNQNGLAEIKRRHVKDM
eukprot:7868661-Ditylum_brightwellii.AAC.1